MFVLGRLHAWDLHENIVEAQKLAAMGLVIAEGLGVDLQGIDDRQHIADPGLPVQRQLIDAADGDVVADQGSDHGLHAACREGEEDYALIGGAPEDAFAP
jgi:hypothetical protein